MSVEQTARVVNSYLHEPGRDRIAQDAVYILMGTGREYRGRAQAEQLLDYLYRRAFQGKFRELNLVIGDGTATLEADFMGKHIGEFEGIPATGREVKVPMCIVYSVDAEHIKTAHVYLDLDSLRRQLGG